MEKIQACLFDLDGVIVDTAKYHYLAWKELAGELGIAFTPASNELLKGVSRMRSLEIILELGGKHLNDEEKMACAEKKNMIYLGYIRKLPPNAILPGVRTFLAGLRAVQIAVVLGSASRNASLILERLKITDLFDAVVDGNNVTNAKPDPEVFLNGAREVHADPSQCVVFEDALAGIEAARNAGMFCVGVGDPGVLSAANLVIPGFEAFTPADLIRTFNREREEKRDN